ncbi:MAG TPA: hypothetical protein PKC24_07350 [Cyclobacteriaceae bacterium]|nr:hypothetical protein [Cyclobacteriaceae bacterium]
MKLSITPFSNIVFWLKALVCSSFYILGFSAFAAPAGFGVAILILLLAFGITILLIRDRVFVFEKETLRISSAINFFPFNRIFRTFTYSLNEIDYIKLSFDDGIRYWGIVFNLELKKNMLTAADIE